MAHFVICKKMVHWDYLWAKKSKTLNSEENNGVGGVWDVCTKSVLNETLTLNNGIFLITQIGWNNSRIVIRFPNKAIYIV